MKSIAVSVLALLTALVCVPAVAQLPPPPVVDPIAVDEAARLMADIDRDRTVLQQAQSKEQSACYKKFVVSSCVQDVREAYRPKFTDLRHREMAVRAGQRRRMEDERQARMADQQRADQDNQMKAAERAAKSASPEQKQTDQQQRQADRAAQQPGKTQQAQAQHNQAVQSTAKAASQQAQRAANAPAEREKYEEKQRLARERRAAQQRRAAEKSQKPPSAPLPQQAPQ